MSLLQHGRHAHRQRHPVTRLLVLALVPVLLSGGTAYAYWTSTGSGTATAKATTAAPLAVGSSGAPVADLYPGKTSDLGFTVSNPNPYPVELTRLTGIAVTSSNQQGCPGSTSIELPSAVTAGVAGAGYVLPSPIPVPAGAQSAAGTLTGLITMATSAPDACQGVTFTATLAFAGEQV